MVTGYLRTNYNRTGGAIDILALGGGVKLASAAGGAGTLKPYGGLVFMSMAMTCKGDTEGGGGPTAGMTYAFFDSVYGITGSYYGAENAMSGCKFFMLNYIPMSVSAVAMSVGIAGGGSVVGWAFLIAQGMSASVWRASFMAMQGNQGSISYMSTGALRLLITGFIASSY